MNKYPLALLPLLFIASCAVEDKKDPGIDTSVYHLSDYSPSLEGVKIPVMDIPDNVIVEKTAKTVSKIKKLSVDERVMEIAQMIGGHNPTESVINNAREMISKG